MSGNFTRKRIKRRRKRRKRRKRKRKRKRMMRVKGKIKRRTTKHLLTPSILSYLIFLAIQIFQTIGNHDNLQKKNKNQYALRTSIDP